MKNDSREQASGGGSVRWRRALCRVGQSGRLRDSVGDGLAVSDFDGALALMPCQSRSQQIYEE